MGGYLPAKKVPQNAGPSGLNQGSMSILRNQYRLSSLALLS